VAKAAFSSKLIGDYVDNVRKAKKQKKKKKQVIETGLFLGGVESFNSRA